MWMYLCLHVCFVYHLNMPWKDSFAQAYRYIKSQKQILKSYIKGKRRYTRLPSYLSIYISHSGSGVMGLTLQQHSLEDFAGFSWCFGYTPGASSNNMLGTAQHVECLTWPTSAQIQHPSVWNIKCQTSAFVSAAIDGASTTLAKRLAGWLQGFSSWRQLLPHVTLKYLGNNPVICRWCVPFPDGDVPFPNKVTHSNTTSMQNCTEDLLGVNPPIPCPTSVGSRCFCSRTWLDYVLPVVLRGLPCGNWYWQWRTMENYRVIIW